MAELVPLALVFVQSEGGGDIQLMAGLGQGVLGIVPEAGFGDLLIHALVADGAHPEGSSHGVYLVFLWIAASRWGHYATKSRRMQDGKCAAQRKPVFGYQKTQREKPKWKNEKM